MQSPVNVLVVGEVVSELREESPIGLGALPQPIGPLACGAFEIGS